MRISILPAFTLAVVLLHGQVASNPKPEFRLILRDRCIVNPPSDEEVKLQTSAFGAVAAVFAPRLIEVGIGAVATLLKKAGAPETEQVSAPEFTSFYVTTSDSRLAVNSSLNCVIGLYGIFRDSDGKPTADSDKALKILESRGVIARDADIDIVFEASVIPSSDHTAMYLDTRHFSARRFIGTRNKDERDFVASLAITAPDATTDGETIALGNIDLGRVLRGSTLPIGMPGGFPRYRSNLMPWKQITEASLKRYTADLQGSTAANKAYMPVTLTLTLSETADGNKFLLALGELLEGAKSDVAEDLAKRVLPAERASAAAEEELSAEKLCAAEEDAGIALRKAEAALAAAKPEARDVATAERDKAKRLYERAKRLRAAAGLKEFCAP